jgi:hypothetical protein
MLVSKKKWKYTEPFILIMLGLGSVLLGGYLESLL